MPRQDGRLPATHCSSTFSHTLQLRSAIYLVLRPPITYTPFHPSVSQHTSTESVLARNRDPIQRRHNLLKSRMPASLTYSSAASLLALDANFTSAELKGAYRRASLRYHPDKAGQESTEAFQRIQDAYHLLQRNERDDMSRETQQARAAADELTWFMARALDPQHYSPPNCKWGFPTIYERSTRSRTPDTEHVT